MKYPFGCRLANYLSGFQQCFMGFFFVVAGDCGLELFGDCLDFRLYGLIPQPALFGLAGSLNS